MRYARPTLYTLPIVLLVSLSCTTSTVPVVARLGNTLGTARIELITTDEMTGYLAERRSTEPEIQVDDSFWHEVRPVIAETIGPTENSERFLRVGFKAFIRDFDYHLSVKFPKRRVLRFNGF